VTLMAPGNSEVGVFLPLNFLQTESRWDIFAVGSGSFSTRVAGPIHKIRITIAQTAGPDGIVLDKCQLNLEK